MTTKAKELARQHYNIGDTENIAVLKAISDLTDLLEKYGRLVQEAAAKECEELRWATAFSDVDRASTNAVNKAARAIREMPLP